MGEYGKWGGRQKPRKYGKGPFRSSRAGRAGRSCGCTAAPPRAPRSSPPAAGARRGALALVVVLRPLLRLWSSQYPYEVGLKAHAA
eukprot:2840387-Pyramimonas_sp.AAC.1